MSVVTKTNICWCVYLLGLPCCMGFSLAVVSRDYSQATVHGLLIAVASLVAEHRLQGMQASAGPVCGLHNGGFVLSYSEACGIFSD